jgi:AcrR family transcriptional regulator
MLTTKDKLLEVAFKEFLVHSYKDVTLSHLVEELGLTKGAFYHYFESKQDLFTQVVDFYLLKISDFGSITYDESLSFVDNILRLVDKSLELFTQVKTGFMNEVDDLNYYNFLLDATKYYPDFIGSINEQHKKKEMEVYLEYISKAKIKGELKISIDSMVLARHIQAVMDGVGFNSYFNESPGYLRNQLYESLNFIYELIKK